VEDVARRQSEIESRKLRQLGTCTADQGHKLFSSFFGFVVSVPTPPLAGCVSRPAIWPA
jgi:hypothetical protein